VEITYTLEEPEILGTAGALDNARQHLENETFLIVNGKIITDIDISGAIETHRKTGAIATMVLKPNAKREKFTIVNTEDGMVKSFGDFARPVTEDEIRDTEHEIETPLMFTGIHILEPRVFDFIPRGVYSDIVPSFYLPAIMDGEKIAAHVADGDWYELSTIPRYLDISLAMMDGQDVFCGEDCSVSESASIRDSVMWDGVVVEDDAHLYRTIIADDVVIQSGEKFENAAIVRADMVRSCPDIPEKALKGYIQGDNYIVPLN
jgi:NDP-sugar pyrophosphorylase family protein